MDEAVKAALGVLFHGDWNDTDGESVGMYLSLEMEDHAWEKRISEALSAADAARAVGDEEVARAIGVGRDGTDYHWKDFVEDARHLRAAGLKVVRG